jgi:hypothetical protein
MDFIEVYYNCVWGCYPFEDDTNKMKSQRIIDYLLEAGISETDILDFVENAPKVDYLTPDLLPDRFWELSLVKRDRFYYHNILHIVSDAPKWDPLSNIQSVAEFHLEMKIRFTMEELINYFYGVLNISAELMDIIRDTGSFNYLLGKYSKFTFIEPLDFVLSLIDYCKDSIDRKIVSILDIAQYESEVYEKLKAKAEQAKFEKANKIVWRK